MVLEDGSILGTPELIHEGATNYFKNFLLMPNMFEQGDLLSLIEKEVSLEDNMVVARVPTFEEVTAALGTISKESAPERDGFGSTFYVHCWDFIKEDVVEAAE